MKEKIKKIIKITEQCINQELICEMCEKENLFLKPAYLAKCEINPGDNFGYVICEKCANSIK
ncbi:MAG: hypothetical protein ACKKMO_01090 [Candidatus Nealsonbacteria bacterium]